MPQDFSEAVKWYRKSAEQGDANAQYRLGRCYSEGKGVPQDFTEAVKWLAKAAHQGDASAQICLGVCYADGKGVREDDVECAKCYRMAAEQGHSEAQYRLSDCYFKGRGVPQDYKEGIAWLRKAAEQGLEIAEKLLLLRTSITTNTDSSSTLPLTIDRAVAIVEYAQNEFASDRCIEDTFTPFSEGGASTRLEAFNALYIFIADWFRLGKR